MANEVSVRLAGHGDYEAVMDINRDVYGGCDYLPCLYHTFILYYIIMTVTIRGTPTHH